MHFEANARTKFKPRGNLSRLRPKNNIIAINFHRKFARYSKLKGEIVLKAKKRKRQKAAHQLSSGLDERLTATIIPNVRPKGTKGLKLQVNRNRPGPRENGSKNLLRYFKTEIIRRG